MNPCVRTLFHQAAPRTDQRRESTLEGEMNMMNWDHSPSRPHPVPPDELAPGRDGPPSSVSGLSGRGSAGAPAWRVLRALVELRHGAALRGAGPAELRQKACQLRELCATVCDLHRIEIEVRGQLPESPAIVVANHLGYIDPVVLCSLLPLSPIAKSEISDWALVGVPLERLNVSFVRRGDAHSGARVLLRSLRNLGAGISVLNFPEGTTSRGGLLPFHLGAFWLARRAAVPVVPIAMDFENMGLCWVDREAFLPHYARVWWHGGVRRVRVSVGQPLYPEDFRSELDLSWAARESITQARAPYARARALP
jgi:1-acyl-sn-glycerol-3-phosphate acyltransferase